MQHSDSEIIKSQQVPYFYVYFWASTVVTLPWSKVKVLQGRPDGQLRDRGEFGICNCFISSECVSGCGNETSKWAPYHHGAVIVACTYGTILEIPLFLHQRSRLMYTPQIGMICVHGSNLVFVLGCSWAHPVHHFPWQGNYRVTELDLSHNHFSEKGGEQLGQMLGNFAHYCYRTMMCKC